MDESNLSVPTLNGHMTKPCVDRATVRRIVEAVKQVGSRWSCLAPVGPTNATSRLVSGFEEKVR